MAKGKFNGMPPMGMGGANRNNMLKQIQKMQQEMEQTQTDLAAQTYEATAGGGVVKAVVSGEKRLVELNIAPEAVDPDDVEMLNDLIVAAVNEALSKAEADAVARMGRLTGGINLNGLF